MLTVTLEESKRIVGLLLESTEITSELFGGLFIWTVDRVDTYYRKRRNPSRQQEAAGEGPSALMQLWTDRARERDNIRHLFRVSFRRILHQLVVRQNRYQRGGITYWGMGDKEQVDAVQSGVADEIIRGFLANVVTILVEHSIEEECNFALEIYDDLKRWDQLISGSSTKLSELLSSITRPPKRRKAQVGTL